MKWFRKRRLHFYREGPAWLEKIKLFFSTKLLDFAEGLPEVRAGVLHNLQYLRSHQRKQADENFDRFQIPKGTVIHLLGFHLIELFHIEDFNNLKNTLRSLFPDSHELHRRDFDKFHGKISYGNWQHQGYLVPQGSKGYLYLDDRAEIENLSSDISYVKLSTYQVTPSIIALIMEVMLKDDAQNSFVDFFKRKYMFPLKLQWRRGSDFPLTSGMGFMHSGAEIEFKKWSEALQTTTEKCIRDYFPGYFSSESSGTLKLPRIDIFAVDESDVLETEETGENENKQRRPLWKDCLGLNIFSTFIDADDKSQWSFPDEIGTTNWPTRIVIDTPSFIKGKDLSGHANEKTYIWYRVIEWLRELTIPYSLAEYFRVEREKIATNRRIVFDTSAARMRLNLQKVFRLLARSESSFIILDRVLMELELVEEYITRQLQKNTKSVVHQFDKDWTLADAFSRNISYNKELLANQSSFLQTTTNQIVNFVNLRATRRLTLFSIIISILSLLIAIIALNFDWSEVTKFLLDFFK